MGRFIRTMPAWYKSNVKIYTNYMGRAEWSAPAEMLKCVRDFFGQEDPFLVK
jgi:hypothetical protein